MPIVDNKEGKLCEYRDYVKLEAENARLKAEVEMMKASSRGHSTSHLYQQMAEENARFKAEVERLTKAGDEMWNALLCAGCSECEGMYDCHNEAMNGWNAAKDGKPSV